MRYEPKVLCEQMSTEAIDSCDWDELPDDLGELAAQLDADADRLVVLYPPQQKDQLPAAPAARRSAWLPRVAAAVCVLGGLTLIVVGGGMWNAAERWIAAQSKVTPRALPDVALPAMEDSHPEPIVSAATVATEKPAESAEPQDSALTAEQLLSDLQQMPGEHVEIVADVNGHHGEPLRLKL
jgi:hypothetical protein